MNLNNSQQDRLTVTTMSDKVKERSQFSKQMGACYFNHRNTQNHM